jgi:hypothetical protein
MVRRSRECSASFGNGCTFYNPDLLFYNEKKCKKEAGTVFLFLQAVCAQKKDGFAYTEV